MSVNGNGITITRNMGEDCNGGRVDYNFCVICNIYVRYGHGRFGNLVSIRNVFNSNEKPGWVGAK